MGTTPRCEADLCVGCIDDSDCGGVTGVCLPDGSCADTSKIIYAAAGGSTDSESCGVLINECSLDAALDQARISTTKNIIKLDNAGPYSAKMGNYMAEVDAVKNLILDARGATLHHNTTGPILTIMSGKELTILGGIIEKAANNGGAGNTDGAGIKCDNGILNVYKTDISQNDAAGILATGCILTITATSIHDNGQGTPSAGVDASGGLTTSSQSKFTSNKGGGIVISSNGKFTIVGNVFASNGTASSVVGGFSAQTAITGNRLDFNTFANNQASTGLTSGAQCVSTGLIAQNNIIWDNIPSSSQVGGNCTYDYSDIGPVAIGGALNGPHNINPSDPNFISTTDLSLMVGSPLRGQANPQADITGIAAKDINGRPRSTPADIGAYVVPTM
jgi:hypothetical protein